MSSFTPIAIVGRGCVLPGALSPAELGRMALEGRSALAPTQDDDWGVERDLVLAPYPAGDDRTWSDRGGRVRHFTLQAEGFRMAPAEVAVQDPLVHWLLHAGRQALREARWDGALPGAGGRVPGRGVAVIGNLSFPTRAFCDFAASVWLDRARPDARHRFMSGLPAQLLADGLGLEAGGFALDAACASSLFAIKLACDRLQDREVDLALAGAVNAADNMFLHVGFSALGALSRSGQSRPFHRDADGLVPAEGAALLCLRRLDDAERDGDRILGVIRGVGLSNDGRGSGLLVPSDEGQERALRAAYDMAGLAPGDVSLLECHATGTQVGDATEIVSTARVFAGRSGIPIGSLKSNLGHLVTASGAAGILKVLAAFEAGVRPPTLNADPPLAALAATPFRLLHEPEPWRSDGPRRAGVSSFGFGGNDAHLIVEEHRPGELRSGTGGRARSRVAVVGLSVRAGDTGTSGFARAVLSDDRGPRPADERRATSVTLELAGLRFPPRDLERALPQQLLILSAVREAVRELGPLPRERTSVMVGMGTDPEVARHNVRGRLTSWARRGLLSPDALPGARQSLAAPLDLASVLGTMPNIPANRVNVELDLGGPSFTVSAEEGSGLVALEVARRGLETGDLDAAIVGAVDLSCEPVHEAAMRALGDARPAGDAAVVLVLQRLDEARRDGRRVLAVIGAEARTGECANEPGASGLESPFGHAHAASGLLQVAAAVLRCAVGAPRVPVAVRSLGGFERRVALESDGHADGVALDAPRIHVFSGEDRRALERALELGEESAAGPARAAIVAASPAELARRRAEALHMLGPGGQASIHGDCIHVRERPVGGELAFVFTSAGAARAGAGRDLALAFPEAFARTTARLTPLGSAPGDELPDAAGDRSFGMLRDSSFLSQLHADLSQGLLGLRPQATVGLSSGESNALMAVGAWQDPGALLRDVAQSGLYGRELGGERRSLQEEWGSTRWRSLRVLGPVHELVAALEPRAHVTIVHTNDDAVLAGDPDACARVLSRVPGHRALDLDYDLVIHCPEVRPFAATWRALHRRETTPVSARIYTHATGTCYRADADACADALTRQALERIELPRVIEAAWRDGVRVFVEHGPGGLMTGWIKTILGDRDHLAVALDDPRPLRGLANAVAALVAAGVPVDLRAFQEHLARATIGSPMPAGRFVQFPAHPPAVRDEAQPAAETLDDRGLHEALLEQHAELARVHTEVLARQAEAHQTFLALREDAMRVLLAAASGGPLPEMPTAWQEPAPIEAPPAAQTPVAPAHVEPAHVARILVTTAEPPRFTRQDLEALASAPVSAVFGPEFGFQDGFRRVVRMPQPPLLLADRVVLIEGQPRSMGRGRIVTETDVRRDWYLHDGVMAAGVMIESGQADLLLISWLGIDEFNRGERVYRLLGCELTYHRPLPRPGDTLRYDIHIDGHAQHGDVRLFFFHYDCHVGSELALSVAGGQAGFFSDEELRDSLGILWDPASDPRPWAEVAPPRATPAGAYSAVHVRAFAEGRGFECFGHAALGPHVRTPRIGQGRLQLVDAVTNLDPQGGPWGRGWLRATTALHRDDWFFQGHFKDDPCMPGTLMFEGALQTMALYLAALGFTQDKDGWRFEPVLEEAYHLRCRGQAIPGARELVCELFVEALVDGPEGPVLTADLLGTVDGLKAFHCKRMKLRLVRDWPLELQEQPVEARPVARLGDHALGYASLVACAWGKPSDAFGAMYRAFDDGSRQVPRLPGPPYHFMSRVVSFEGTPNALKTGSVVVEYDPPAGAWYFEQSRCGAMPWAVLIEAALQPCGWLASWTGVAALAGEELRFRNLDGTATVHRRIEPGTRRLVTRAALTTLAQSGGSTIVAFDVTLSADEELALTLKAVFGFFPPAALAVQAGIAVTLEQRAWLDEASDFLVDLTTRPSKFVDDLLPVAGLRPTLEGPMLQMLDRVTGWWDTPEGTWLRSEKTVRPDEWFFKAHFFQDPVQPGSLGLEAWLGLLRFFMIERGLADGIAEPRFEPVESGRTFSWKFRGQVVPGNARIQATMRVTESGRDERGAFARAEAWLWVDGTPIYAGKDFGMRVSPGPSLRREAMKGPCAADGADSIADVDFAYARELFGVGPSLLEDLHRGLLARFVGHVHVADPAVFDRGALFLANHQVHVESVLFPTHVMARGRRPVVTLAKIEQKQRWIGPLVQAMADYPGVRDPGLIEFFDQEDRASLFAILERLGNSLAARSVLVHVEGGRAGTCRRPVTRMSSVWADLALDHDAPIVPVRFTGGLPVIEGPHLEFPVGFGRQDHWIGGPIPAATLRSLPYAERTRHVVAAINALGPANEHEEPAPPDRAFAAAVEEWRARATDTGSVFLATLESLPAACDETRAFLDAVRRGRPHDGPRAGWLRGFASWLTGHP